MMHLTIVASQHALYHYDITPLPGCFAVQPGWLMVVVSETAQHWGALATDCMGLSNLAKHWADTRFISENLYLV